jgi:hypothetical protein
MKLLSFCYYEARRENHIISIPDKVKGLQAKIALNDMGDDYYHSIGYSRKHIEAARLHKYPVLSWDTITQET